MSEREIRRRRLAAARLQERIGGTGANFRAVRSPLRICPLGAHVDHQLGRVTGLTLDEAVLLVFSPRTDDAIRLWSLDFPGETRFRLSEIPSARPGDWGNYPRGAALALRQTRGVERGLDGVISGPLPVGGLSSSAAVDVAYLLALEAVNDLLVTPLENIDLARRIENDYIGLNNGILDQSIVLNSRRGHLTWLDCLDTSFDHIPAPPELRFDIVIAYSGLGQALVGTDYNQRVAECRAAAAELCRLVGHMPPAPLLRHVPAEAFDLLGRLPDKLARRARHFHEEQARVEAGVAAWRAGDAARLGALMTASGHSSIVNYECGSPHLISLYEMLNETAGVHGARFSGAGFRGSCVALAEPGHREAIAAAIAARYPVRHPDVAETYSLHFCAPAGPAEVLS